MKEWWIVEGKSGLHIFDKDPGYGFAVIEKSAYDELKAKDFANTERECKKIIELEAELAKFKRFARIEGDTIIIEGKSGDIFKFESHTAQL